MNEQQWNEETLLELQGKYRDAMRQVKQYERQIGSSYDESIFLSGEEEHFFKMLNSCCLDFDLMLLEVTTDLSCFKLDALGDVIEAMFKVQKTCLEKLCKQLQSVYSNNKIIKTRFSENTCKSCARSLEEVKLNMIFQKTTLTQDSLNREIKRRDEKDARQLQNFLGMDREEFLRMLEQALNEKSISLSKRPADTEETLRSFLNDFKDRNDTSKQNQEKERIVKVLEDIRKEQNIQILAELTKTIKNSLLLSVKQPLLDYADKISLLKAEKIVADSNSRRVRVEQETQTVQTNVSEMIRKYQNKIKTITSQLGVRKQRTKELEKQLLSALLSNSTHNQLMSDAKTKCSVLQESSQKSESLRIELELQFEQYKEEKGKQLDSLIYNHQEEVSELRREIKAVIEESDRLREQYHLLAEKSKGESISTQTFVVKYQNQGMQTVERQVSKRMSKVYRRESKISSSGLSDLGSMLTLDIPGPKPSTLLQPTEEEKEHNQKEKGQGRDTSREREKERERQREREKERERQMERQKAMYSFSFEPFIESIKRKTYQEAGLKSINSQNQEEQYRSNRQYNLTENNIVIDMKILPDLPKSDALEAQTHKRKVEINQKRRFPKFGHKSNLSELLPQTTQRVKTQEVFSSEKMSKLRRMVPSGASPILQKQIQFKSSPHKKQNSSLRFHNISYSRVQKIHNKIASTQILPLRQVKAQEQTQKQEEEIVSKKDILKQIPYKFANLNSKIVDLDGDQGVKRELEAFKSLNREMKIQRSKNISVKQLGIKRKEFYIDHKGEKILIKDKLNEIKNVLLYEFQFLNRIGVIECLAKLSKRILNHTKVININHHRNYSRELSQPIVFSTKDFGLFGGYESAVKYQIGKGLWSPQLHVQNYNQRVNNIVSFIQGLGASEYQKISNFIMYPIKSTVYEKREPIKSTHLRVTLNTIYNYHHSFCDDCNHIKVFLERIGYM